MWIPLVYRDVDLNRYEISDEGKIRKVDGTILAGCNPANEKGYLRIGLVTKDGKMKKYGLHRLILAGFTGDSDLEVDHVDGNKLNNALSNLEYVTGDENKRRAAANGLYKTCEDHPFASFTNDQVHLICKRYSEGVNVRSIERELGLVGRPGIDAALGKILNRTLWRNISKDYEWNYDEVHFKKYTKEHLLSIAYLAIHSSYTSREIAKKYPQYDEQQLVHVIKKIRQGKLYKGIVKEAEGSTTIAEEPRDGDGFIVLVKKH